MENERKHPADIAGCLLRAAAPVTWICLILIGSLMPSGPPGPAGLTFPGMDLVFHFAAYAVFAALTAWALEGSPVSARGCMAVVFPLCIGGMLEVVQPLVGRTMSWKDAVANGAGALVGFALAEAVLRASRAR